jgi:hypothetical protein
MPNRRKETRAGLGVIRERLRALFPGIAAALYATGGAADFGFSAETRVAEAAPLTLRTVITVTNRGRAVAELVVSRYCPVHLRVYVDASVHAEPVWDSGRLVCSLVATHFMMQPGASRQFTRTTRATDILGDSLVPGRYQLEAMMWVDRPNRLIELPTGSGHLSR